MIMDIYFLKKNIKVKILINRVNVSLYLLWSQDKFTNGNKVLV